MLSRIRTAIGLSFLLALITFSAAFAKGSYSFITITGPTLKDEVRSTDPALTTDFFAFADFYRAKAETPDHPGPGYEITRYYIDNGAEVAFDQLHYYPDSGFVYYDGILNGSSEYDGKWYTARSEIKTAFENALGITPASTPKSVQVSRLFAMARSVLPMIVTVGLAVVLLLAYRLRRSSAH